MRDLALNTVSHDILIVGGDFLLVDSLAQRLKQRLLVLSGEWFLNKEMGLSYIDNLFTKKSAGNYQFIEGQIRQIIRETIGVQSLDNFSLELNSANRTAKIDFSITAEDGSKIKLEVIL